MSFDFGLGAGISGLVSRRQMKRQQSYNQANFAAESAFNAQQAAINRGFQSAEAEKNRAFQEYMSSTTHTRSARDLKKAGLNRILALGQPSPTSAGAMASGSQASAAGKTSSIGGGANANLDVFSALEAYQRYQLLQESTRKESALADKEEFTKAPYKIGNRLLDEVAKHSNSAMDIYKQAPQIFRDVKELMKAYNESLKQKAYSHQQKRERLGGNEPITTIHINKGNDR